MNDLSLLKTRFRLKPCENVDVSSRLKFVKWYVCQGQGYKIQVSRDDASMLVDIPPLIHIKGEYQSLNKHGGLMFS